MKIGVIGHKGSVGELLLQKQGYIPLPCDITNPQEIEETITKGKPDVIVSLAGKTDPDWCEKDENFDEVFQSNISGVFNLLSISEQEKIPTVILSTDHVFSGKSYYDFGLMQWIKKGAYREDYNKKVPVNLYGHTKSSAEYFALDYSCSKIVRTSYLFSRERLYPLKASYPAFMYRSFMHIEHFVEQLDLYLHRVNEMPKMLHLSGSKVVSWKTFIKALPDSDGVHFHNKDKEGFAPRPHKAGLITDLSRSLGFPQYDYLDGIKIL